MSGGGKTKTSTSTTIDSRTNNQQGEFNLSGDGNAVSIVDGGAFEFGSELGAQAFEFGAGSVDGAFDLSRSVVDSARDTNRMNLDAAVKLAQGAQHNADQQNIRSFQFAKSASAPDKFDNQNVKYIAGAAALVVIGLMFRGRA